MAGWEKYLLDATGANTDAPADAVEDTTARSLMSLVKGLKNYLKTLAGAVSAGKVGVSASQLPAALAAGGGLKVEGVAGGVAMPVAGAFYQATQPVSVALPATLVHSQKTIATAGTEEALGGNTTLTSGVRVKALHDNTGWVYVGLNPVSSTTGFVLDAGEEVFLEVANLATIFVDVSVNGEGVSYIGS